MADRETPEEQAARGQDAIDFAVDLGRSDPPAAASPPPPPPPPAWPATTAPPSSDSDLDPATTRKMLEKEGCSPGFIAIIAAAAVLAAVIAFLLWDSLGDDSSSNTETVSSTGIPAGIPAGPTESEAIAPAVAIDGTYAFTATVAAGSNPDCNANNGQFVVTTTGAGPNRQITLAAGGGQYTGSLRPDNSFETTAPVTTGTGSDTFVGSFDVSATPVTLTGDDTITGQTSDGLDVTCKFRITGRKI